jgi:hypothetical protein
MVAPLRYCLFVAKAACAGPRRGRAGNSRNPNNADSYVWLARIPGYVGKAEEAIELVHKAMRLNPHYPPLYILSLGLAYHCAWQNEEAIATFQS